MKNFNKTDKLIMTVILIILGVTGVYFEKYKHQTIIGQVLNKGLK